MQGFDTLWLPGTDHSSISTEMKVVQKLAKEGKSKQDLGREKFLEKAWEWKHEYAECIHEQWEKMGLAFWRLFLALFTYHLFLEGLKKIGLVKAK